MKITALICIFLALIMNASASFAQNFSAILERLDKIQGRIDSLEQVQKQDVKNLTARVEKIAPDRQGVVHDVNDMHMRMNNLEQGLEQVIADKANPSELGNVDALSKDIRQLIQELKKTASPNQKEVINPESDYASNLSVDIGVDFLSKYVWRGYRLADTFSIQPGITLDFEKTGFAFNIWGSAAVQNRGAPQNLTEVDELDFTLSYDRSFGIASNAVGISLGYIQYTFPNMLGAKHSEELYAGLNLDNAIAPALTVYYDFGLVRAWYMAVEINPKFSLDSAGTAHLAFKASTGFSNAERSFGFTDLLLSATLSVNWKAASIAPTFAYSWADGSVNTDNDTFWSGVSISYNR